MHKSWGNAIEFNEAADKMGVDVMRWLFATHKPENDLIFAYERPEHKPDNDVISGFRTGDDVRKDFIFPLWNVYSFFATYARLDGWQPDSIFDPNFPEGDTPQSDNLLDRWILARLKSAG